MRASTGELGISAALGFVGGTILLAVLVDLCWVGRLQIAELGLLLVISLCALSEGGRRRTVVYPRVLMGERIASLGNPTGKRLGEVRAALGGYEDEMERTESGTRRTWSRGGVAVEIAFGADKVCTGVVRRTGMNAARD